MGHRTPAARLVVTGVDADQRARVAAAFQAVLCTPQESAASHWSAHGDGPDPWLGELTAAADREVA